ncbi:hypothetical protein MJ904_19980 [Massilia sp. MB5]|uniref:hypothetical protein n=1 Tax=Massilia sp. MB5 TaxID=2919578 RepID=UPI001F10B554|nr:hypothetical protein [Massilia sp. MB5]UMR29335.1 hypothetical protein MJ904_19980 [Massilia sp. MB5]
MPPRQISFHIPHPEAVLAAGLRALLDGQRGLRPAPLAEADVLLTDYDHALRHAGRLAKLDASARTHAVVVAAQRGLIAVRAPDSRSAAGGRAGA